jgi:hypothetical protein
LFGAEKRREGSFACFRFLNSLTYFHLHKTNKNLFIEYSSTEYVEKRKTCKESNALIVNKKEYCNGKKPLPRLREKCTTTRNSMCIINTLKNIQKDQNGAI